jgi:hypothetical protein
LARRQDLFITEKDKLNRGLIDCVTGTGMRAGQTSLV